MGSPPASDILLREATEDDLVIFFEQQQDPAANWMAAFTAKDPTDWPAFAAKWAKILDDRTGTAKTIVCGGHVAGYLLNFVAPWSGQREVSYWVGRDHWGRGVATTALAAFVGGLTMRPLYARAAADNMASIRVLEKCGFVRIGRDRASPTRAGRRSKKWSWSCGRDRGSGRAEPAAAADRRGMTAFRGSTALPPRRLLSFVDYEAVG